MHRAARCLVTVPLVLLAAPLAAQEHAHPGAERLGHVEFPVSCNAQAGAWVFLSGVVVGPSVGQFYAGQTARAAGTIGLRAAGSAVGISSLVGCFSD